jgi:hypothetical protein
MLAAQPVDFALLSFQLFDQLIARRRAPFRPEHVWLMPRFVGEYKRNTAALAPQNGRSERITR